MTKTNKLNDGDFQQVCTVAGTLQNNHENNSVEQKHSKREHHILFWIKMTTHLLDSFGQSWDFAVLMHMTSSPHH